MLTPTWPTGWMPQGRRHVAGWGAGAAGLHGTDGRGAEGGGDKVDGAGRREGRRAAWRRPAGAESVPPPVQEEPETPETLPLSSRISDSTRTFSCVLPCGLTEHELSERETPHRRHPLLWMPTEAQAAQPEGGRRLHPLVSSPQSCEAPCLSGRSALTPRRLPCGSPTRSAGRAPQVSRRLILKPN